MLFTGLANMFRRELVLLKTAIQDSGITAESMFSGGNNFAELSYQVKTAKAQVIARVDVLSYQSVYVRRDVRKA